MTTDQRGSIGCFWCHIALAGILLFSPANGHSQSNTGDYDGDGLRNIEEYGFGSDPNTISFDVNFTNLYVNMDTVYGTFTIFGGVPRNMAVLVGTTNFQDAVWMPYAPTIPVNLGSTDGTWTVWIGLKGSSPDSTVAWQGVDLTREVSGPVIVITNPAPGTLSQPMIQLQGYSLKPLRSLMFDLTNQSGSLRADNMGGVVDQWFDRTLFDFTTNWFMCSDISLSNGVNTVILRATDLAGNTSTNVFTYNLDYSIDTNPPVMSKVWPPDGSQVCGDTFTMDGYLDDATASLSAYIVDAGGGTNLVATLVQWTGRFWVKDIPLPSGTNVVTLIATDAAGNTSSTNVTVIKGTLTLLMSSYTGDLWDPTVTVYGTVSDSTYAVWVNGVKATVQTSGSWVAVGVPVPDGGTATFEMVAYAPGEPQP
ncbi:MAG: hypothetical protein U1F98_01045 [Verrucomicrobiota bacterium]